MANAFATPDVIAQRALASLINQSVMLPLVYRDVESDFARAKVGDTVNVRKPAVFEAKPFNRASGIEIQDITETTVPVVLDQFWDVSFAITAEQFALEVDQLQERVINPAMEAMALAVDLSILSLCDDITNEVGQGPNGTPPSAHTYNDPKVLIDAGKVLNDYAVPQAGRNAVVGTQGQADWLATDTLVNAGAAGDTLALRQASLGAALFGFRPYWTQNIKGPAAGSIPEPGDSLTEVGVAFHPTAFAFASAPQELAPGATGSVQDFRGLSLRVTWDYEQRAKQTIFSVDLLWGVKTLDANRAVLIKGADEES